MYQYSRSPSHKNSLRLVLSTRFSCTVTKMTYWCIMPLHCTVSSICVSFRWSQSDIQWDFSLRRVLLPVLWTHWTILVSSQPWVALTWHKFLALVVGSVRWCSLDAPAGHYRNRKKVLVTSLSGDTSERLCSGESQIGETICTMFSAPWAIFLVWWMQLWGYELSGNKLTECKIWACEHRLQRWDSGSGHCLVAARWDHKTASLNNRNRY